MADDYPYMGSSLRDYLAQRYPQQPQQPQAAGMVSGNPLTAGLATGVLGGGANVASGLGTIAQKLGATGAADWLNREAAAAQAQAQGYRRSDLENNWTSPSGIVYNLAQQAPSIAATLPIGGALGAGLRAAGVGAKIATGLGMASAFYPQAVGQTLQATGKPPGQNTPEQQTRALEVGVPEAALGAIPMGRLESLLGRGAPGGLLHAITGQAATQAAVSTGQDLLAQAFGDPDRPVAFDAQRTINAAFGGAIAGGVFGAAAHGISKLDPGKVTNEQLEASMAPALGEPAPAPEPEAAAPPPPEPAAPVEPEDTRPVFTPSDLAQQGRGEPPETRPVATPSERRAEWEAAQAQQDYWTGQAYPPAEPAPPPAEPEDTRPVFTPSDLAQQGRGEPPDTRVVATPSERRAQWEDAQRVADYWASNGHAAGGPPLKSVEDRISESTPNGKVPAWLEGVQTPEDAQAAIRQKWETSGPNRIVRNLADEFDMLDENGDLRSPPEPVAEPNRPPIDTLPEQHQGRAQALEDLREALPEHADAIDAAQSALAAPQRGETAQIDKTIRDLQAVAQGNEATDRLTAPTEPVDRFADTKQAVMATDQSLDKLRQMDAASESATPRQRTLINNKWRQGLADQQARLDTIGKELAAGTPENLEGLPSDHFRNDAFTASTRFSPEAQQALDAHTELEQDLLDKLDAAQPKNAFASAGVDAGSVLDPLPRNIRESELPTHAAISETGSGRAALQAIARNGNSGLEKTVANLLLQKGVDPEIGYANPARANVQTQLRANERVMADYDADQNRINIYDPTNLNQRVLHEGVHAATLKGLNAGGPAAQEMGQLYNDVKVRSPGNDAYGLRDVREFVAEAFTNPDFQDHLASLSTEPTVNRGVVGNAWQKFKGIVGRILGAKPSQQTMLDHVLDAGQRLMDENGRAAPVQARAASIAGDTEKIKDYTAQVTDLGQRIADAGTSLGTALYKGALGWRGVSDIARGIADTVPSALRHTMAEQTREARENVWNKAAGAAANLYKALPKQEQDRHNLVAAATVYKLDATKPWAQQAPELFSAPNAADLQAVHNLAYREWGRMSGAGKAVYQALVDTRQAHLLASWTQSLHDHVLGAYPDITQGFENDPAHDFQFAAAAHDDPALAKAFWLAEMDKRQAGIQAAMSEVLSKNKGVLPDAIASLKRYDDTVNGVKASLSGVPNFHVSHGEGRYFVAGSIVADEDGMPSAKAVEAINARLEKEGYEAVIEKANTNDRVFMRVSSQAQAERLRQVFTELQKEEYLSDEKGVASGLTEQAAKAGVGPAAMEDMIAAMRAGRPEIPEGTDPAQAAQYEAAWDEGVRQAVNRYMDLFSDSSPMKVFASRANVQAFAKDMGESFSKGVPAVSRMLANQGIAREKGQATQGIRQEVYSLKHADVPIAQKETTQAAVNEILRKEVQRPTAQPNGFIQAMRSISHKMEIGTSPGYTLMLLLQNLTMTLPEFGSSHGFLKSATEQAKATLPSFKVMRAMTADPAWTNAGMRLKTLTDGGVEPGLANYLVHLDNMGAFNASSFTHAMSPHEEGDGLRAKVSNWSSALGLYSEQQPRIQAAIMAKALWRGPEKDGDLHQFALDKVKQAQLDWSQAETARQVTNNGIAGPLSPLINQFSGYRIKFTAKLYQEFHDLIAPPGGDPQARLEAGKYLAGHIAAITMLSGALGLPMVGVAASVYDKLADILTGEPDHDITASFRHFLAHTYGAQAGEAIARGAPRLLGIDLSREGDQAIAPGSSTLMMLTEKRKFEDAERDWLKNMAGSAIGFWAGTALGLRDISNGDWLNGAQKMVPEVLRGGVEAVRLLKYGYQDKKGNALPIKASTRDMILTALGEDPADEEEYNEVNRTRIGLDTRRQLQSTNITNHLILALNQHNPQNLQYWLNQSKLYQQQNRGLPPPAQGLNREMRLNAQNAAIARSLGMPIGTRANNIKERNMTDYGNLTGR